MAEIFWLPILNFDFDFFSFLAIISSKGQTTSYPTDYRVFEGNKKIKKNFPVNFSLVLLVFKEW
jgi:hypothetical protein